MRTISASANMINIAIEYAYAQFPPTPMRTNRTRLAEIIDRGLSRGLLFLSDADARPGGRRPPLASLWDNGADPVAMLRTELEVRRIALDRFGLDEHRSRRPMAMLEAKLLPLYLHHRYQLLAAVKTIGGHHYTYAVKAERWTVPVTGLRDRSSRSASARRSNAVLTAIDPGRWPCPTASSI